MNDEYMVRPELYPKKLDGISDEQIAQHWALYEGYVKNVNLLDEKIAHLTRKGEYGAEFSELKRRQSFEYNGMVLHEYYFGVLKAKQAPPKEFSDLAKKLGACFGGFEAWKREFIAMGCMRGTGWAILYHDPVRSILTNVWISSHEDGHPAGCAPILVMDVWEHAYMVDWGAGGRLEYINKFLKNVDWAKVEGAFCEAAHASPALPAR